jgi:hypothetical protein
MITLAPGGPATACGDPSDVPPQRPGETLVVVPLIVSPPHPAGTLHCRWGSDSCQPPGEEPT